MSTKFLTVLLLLTLSSHATWTVGTDDGIDPKPLTWWRDTWTARPIEVSRSNASTDSNTLSKATLTFKVRTSTNLPIGGVFEVYFPTSFTAPSGNVDNYQTITLNQAVTAGTEYPVVIENVTMPTQSAAYGPFRIITRPNSGG